MTLSENIKRLRTEAGLNQVQFGKKLCVSKQCVSNWENDNILPSIEMLTKIADFFNVSTDLLLGRATDDTVDVSGLSDTQKAHISLLISDFKQVNII